MSTPAEPGASARRLAIWASFLVLPLLLGALFLPGLIRSLRAAGPGATAPAEPREAPRQPEAPTADQIEAAREAQEAHARAQAGWKTSQTYAPRSPERDASGSLFSPFQGFGVDVETTPPGAEVVVNGRSLGQSPLLASVPCQAGEALELSLKLAGYQVHRRGLRCRADRLQHLAVELRR